MAEGGPVIYELGYPNIGNCDTTDETGYNVPGLTYPDAKVVATLLRWGNYDYFNKATRFVASEIPAGVAVPTDQVIPSSYYYSAIPAWWPAAIPWPPIGPDVTGGNGDTSGHVNKTPAQVCWETRNLLTGGSFSASACYAGGRPTSPVLQVTPATNIAASGMQGGPFSPSSFSYTLSATTGSVNYTVTNVPSWLTASPTSGIATTKATSVTFRINTGAAGKLKANTNTNISNINFNDTTNDRVTTRAATLTVTPKNFTVKVSTSPTAGGTVTGGGTFAGGTSDTVTATPKSGHIFLHWTENGRMVSTSESYTFTVNANATLVAIFR